MSATERRSEIINILRDRHRINASELASMLDVTTRTIRNDIQALTHLYPIWTQSGHGGGIFLEKEPRLTRRPYGNTLELPELETLLKLYHMSSGTDREHLYSIIMKYGPSNIDETMRKTR